MARPGRVRVAFGKPLHLSGDDYEAAGKASRGQRYGIWIKPCRCSDGLCPMTHEEDDMRSLTAALLLGASLVAGACAGTSGRVYVRTGPPPLRREAVIVSPGPGYVWLPGYYHYERGGVRLGRRTIRASATRARPLGAWALAAAIAAAGSTSRDTGGDTPRRTLRTRVVISVLHPFVPFPPEPVPRGARSAVNDAARQGR